MDFARKTSLFSAARTGLLCLGFAGAYAAHTRLENLSADAEFILNAAQKAAGLASLSLEWEGSRGATREEFRSACYELGRAISPGELHSPESRSVFSAINSDYYALLPLADDLFLRSGARGRSREALRESAARINRACLYAAGRNRETRGLLLAQTSMAFYSLLVLMLLLEGSEQYLVRAPFFEGLSGLRDRIKRYAEPFTAGTAPPGEAEAMRSGVDALEGALQASMLERMRMAKEAAGRQARMKTQTKALELTRRKVMTLVEDLEEARSELQREKKALKLTGEKLARSNRELEQFAYVASHDLKEPLRIVSSFGGLLAKRYTGKLDPDANDFIRYITEGAQRATELINALFNYSKVTYSTREFTLFSSLTALQKAIFNMKISIEEKKARITWDTLPMVKGDEFQLIQLFQNLLANSLKFNAAHEPEIHVGCLEGPGNWTLSFSDNGIGIPREHYERVFLIFQRLHPQEKYPGAGIGLALCKKIAENHGGRMWVDSKPGEGSTFYLELPKPAEAAAAAGTTEHELAEKAG